MVGSTYRAPVALGRRRSRVSRSWRALRSLCFFFFQAEDGIRDYKVTGVQTCALPISLGGYGAGSVDKTGGAAGARTDRDIPMKWVLVGCLAIIIAIMLSAPLHMNLLGALLILVFGFLFSTVSSQLTGEIGSSSNPISGMTVATLLLTCLIFLVVGWTGGPYYVTALSVGAIVCIASSNAGATSQDLKTGFLIGATPRLQQIAILAGALASAVVLGPILLKLNDAATVYVPIAQIAPRSEEHTSELQSPCNLVCRLLLE